MRVPQGSGDPRRWEETPENERRWEEVFARLRRQELTAGQRMAALEKEVAALRARVAALEAK